MENIIAILSELNQVIENCSEALMHDKITKTQAKHELITELCISINSFAMVNIDTYFYIHPCADAIYNINLATNDEQIVRVCLRLIKWTAETIHELMEDEDYE